MTAPEVQNTSVVNRLKFQVGLVFLATIAITAIIFLLDQQFSMVKKSPFSLSTILILLSTCAGAAITISTLLHRHLAQPLRVLDHAAKEIAAGHYELALEPLAHNELGRMGETLVLMANALQARNTALASNAAVLKKQVQEWRHAEQTLRSVSEKLQLATEAAFLGVWDWHLETDQHDWDAQTYRLFGLEPNEVKPSRTEWMRRIHPADMHHVEQFEERLQHDPSDHINLEYRVLLRDGTQRFLMYFGRVSFNEEGKAVRVTGVQMDVTERKLAEKRVVHMATHDPLTGLANRSSFRDRVQQSLAACSYTQQQCAVLFVDLDHFKSINDTLGHTVGDELLKRIASKLGSQMRRSDAIARLGGDEFAILLGSINKAEDASLMAQKIVTLLGEPVLVEGLALNITPSIGISIYPNDGLDPETLISNADIAMYQAKANGRNNFRRFTAEMGEHISEMMHLEQALRHAIEAREFEIYYQAKVGTNNGCIIGAEALIRWRRPKLGLVGPSSFIPLAEERGLILGINRFVLSTVCAQQRTWLDAGITAVPIAVNLTAGHLSEEGLLQEVQDFLAATRLTANLLQLEITESALLQDESHVAANLKALRQMGIKISIDDFGTGYSSLAYLHRFPVDILKIDGSFVRMIGHESGEISLVPAIIGIAHSLNLRVVAEGVETDEQRAFLSAHGCDQIQGYLYSRPVPAKEFAELLRAGKKLH